MHIYDRYADKDHGSVHVFLLIHNIFFRILSVMKIDTQHDTKYLGS